MSAVVAMIETWAADRMRVAARLLGETLLSEWPNLELFRRLLIQGETIVQRTGTTTTAVPNYEATGWAARVETAIESTFEIDSAPMKLLIMAEKEADIRAYAEAIKSAIGVIEDGDPFNHISQR